MLTAKGRTSTSYGTTFDEVVEMLLEDGEPKFEAESVGVQVIQVA